MHHRLRMMDEVLAAFGNGPDSWLAAFGRFEAAFVYKQGMAKQSEADTPADMDPHRLLYTDTDVIFLQPVDLCSLPQLTGEDSVMLVGAELEPSRMENSGVLLIDVARWLAVEDSFFAFCRQSQWKGIAMDQGLLREFLGEETGVRPVRMQLLPNGFNWKGYWGWPLHSQPPARIFHFHGPKPRRCLDARVWSHTPCPEGYERLLPTPSRGFGGAIGQTDVELDMYAFMLTLFEHYYNMAACCSIARGGAASAYSAMQSFEAGHVTVC